MFWAVSGGEKGGESTPLIPLAISESCCLYSSETGLYMATGEVVCDCKVVLGEEKDESEFGSGDETQERGVGSGDDMSDLGLSSGWSPFLLELIGAMFAADGVRVCDFLEDHGRGIVIEKLCFLGSS